MAVISRASAAVVLVSAILACGGDDAVRDGGMDGGLDSAVDAPALDGASPDADLVDSGMDAEPVDSGTPPRLVRFWGGLGREPGQFIEPSSIEIDSEGFVYVAGHEDRFQKFTADGELVDISGSPGEGDGEFDHPHGLAVDRARGDLIYVGDQENNRLQVFLPSGMFVRQWGDALFQHIHDVGIDPSTGDVFVGDLETNIVRRFTASGEVVWRVGATGTGAAEFDGIWGMSTDSAGNIYIADSNNDRIQVLTRDGNYVRQWSSFAGIPFNKPTGVYVHSDDLVYVCDSLDEAIMVFDVEGNPVERWLLPEIVGFVTEPEDIVLDATGANIYIAEVRQARVLQLAR